MLSLLFFVAHAQTPPPSPWEKSIFADGRGGACTQASFFVFGWWTCCKGEIRIVENCCFFVLMSMRHKTQISQD